MLLARFSFFRQDGAAKKSAGKVGRKMNSDNEEGKAISAAKIDVNRRNAQKSTGPKDTTSTRYNAVKHGLLAEGVTELDSPETFLDFCAKIEADRQPVGEIETLLTRRVALCLARLMRAGLLEAEFLTAQLNPAIIKTTGGAIEDFNLTMNGKVEVLDPGLPARLSADAVDTLTSKFGRYETAVENKLYRALQQLERLQALRKDEMPPVPKSSGGDTPVEPVASLGKNAGH